MPPSNLFLVSSDPTLVDPFSKKGALILFWLLASKDKGIDFSINQAARNLGVMPFTVHRVVRTLEYDGIIRTKGIGTKKRFHLADPKALLIKWLRHYHIQRKSKLHRYSFSNLNEFKLSRKELLSSSVVPALHTAARSVFHVGVTNLSITEGYLVNVKTLSQIERKFALVEQERGYEILLIEPYYLSVIERYCKTPFDRTWKSVFAVLTFLDLYHFPLRGREQAEALYRKVPTLKTLGSWSTFDSIEVI